MEQIPEYDGCLTDSFVTAYHISGMASASSDPAAADAPARERAARLAAELERSERRREAAEQWAAFLEAELDARDDQLEDIIVRYERELEDVKRRQRGDDGGGLWARLTGWF